VGVLASSQTYRRPDRPQAQEGARDLRDPAGWWRRLPGAGPVLCDHVVDARRQAGSAHAVAEDDRRVLIVVMAHDVDELPRAVTVEARSFGPRDAVDFHFEGARDTADGVRAVDVSERLSTENE